MILKLFTSRPDHPLGEAKLPQIIYAHDAPARFLSPAERRQKHSGENRDDRDDNE